MSLILHILRLGRIEKRAEKTGACRRLDSALDHAGLIIRDAVEAKRMCDVGRISKRRQDIVTDSLRMRLGQ